MNLLSRWTSLVPVVALLFVGAAVPALIGAVGLCLLLGGIRHPEQTFRLEAAASALAALIALTTLSLALPAFTTGSVGTIHTDSQLAFAAVASLLLWGVVVFVFVQTVRHRDYFLPPTGAGDESTHAPPPTMRLAWPGSASPC